MSSLFLFLRDRPGRVVYSAPKSLPAPNLVAVTTSEVVGGSRFRQGGPILVARSPHKVYRPRLRARHGFMCDVQDPPPQFGEVIPAVDVPVPMMSARMLSVAVDFDGQEQLRVGEIDPCDESVGVVDLVLSHGLR